MRRINIINGVQRRVSRSGHDLILGALKLVREKPQRRQDIAAALDCNLDTARRLVAKLQQHGLCRPVGHLGKAVLFGEAR